MTITFADTAIRAIAPREIDASIVESFRTALTKQVAADFTSKNSFVKAGIERRAVIMQGAIDAAGGRSSTMGALLVRERDLVIEIAEARRLGADYTERARSLGRVRGQINTRLLGQSN